MVDDTNMRKLLHNQQGSVIPILLFILALIGFGALYTLFFIEIALPEFSSYVPASDSKTFILMFIYGMPLIVIVVGVISLLKAGLKQQGVY